MDIQVVANILAFGFSESTFLQLAHTLESKILKHKAV